MARFDFCELTSGGIGAVVRDNGAMFFDMGMRAALGTAGVIDLVSAHMFFNLADRHGDERGAFHRQDVAAQMTKSDLSRALRAAREWLAAA